MDEGVNDIGIYTWPLIVIVVVICILATLATMEIIRAEDRHENPDATENSMEIGQQPLVMKPMILIYIIVSLSLSVVIFYYWASS